MLNVKIEASATTVDGIVEAVQEALQRIEGGNTSGHDRNSTSSFSFEVDGTEEQETGK